MLSKARGFTLIEMVVTVAIVGTLASVLVPFAQLAIQRNKERELKLALREIRHAIDTYKQAGDEGRIYRSATTTGYPESLKILVQGVPNMKDPKGGKLYFLRRIPRDPMHTDTTIDPEATWGKRAYASEPDDPRDGDDVYDIYSLSTKAGLDGRPYRTW